MLQKVKEITNDFNIPCQMSLEIMMACGFGVCLGCNIPSASKEKGFKYACKDGPVFDSNEIELDV